MFYSRGADGKIDGGYASQQTPPVEDLPDDHPDVIEWRQRLVPQRRIDKIAIVERLKAAGLLVAANAALNAADTADTIELAERWYQPPGSVTADDPRVRAFLAAIGADPETILGP